MGFFTLELARLVGPEGRVIAVEVQPQMVAGLTETGRTNRPHRPHRNPPRVAGDDGSGGLRRRG
jgi:hypothetical protein